MRLSKRRPIVLWIGLVAAAVLCLVLFMIPYEHLPNLPHVITSYSKKPQPIWLVATISAASSQRRRNIIRATMHKAYSSPNITFRFVISNPTDLWMPLIQHENDTFGDLIMLPHLKESPQLANTIKTVEFLTYAFKSLGFLWKYMSKVDDDSFVALTCFYEQYLVPLLELEKETSSRNHNQSETEMATPHVLIGRKIMGWRQYPYPGGQFYTLSRQTAKAVVSRYSTNPIKDEDEDVLIGRLLYEAGEEFDVTELMNPVAFDYDAINGDEWAWSHNITGPDALNPHKMKEDEVYLKVAEQMLALHPGHG